STLGEAFVPIRATLDKLDSDLASARSKVEGAMSGIAKIADKIGTSVQAVGKIALVGLGAGLAALTGAITGAAFASVSWAEKLDSVGDVLGTTTQESAALAVAAQHIGGNVEQLSSQMAIMTRGLFDATGAIGPTGEVLKGLGISFQDANGKMLPTTDILQQVADKIGGMPDGLEKTQLMMDVFGKSGKDMSDMLGALAGGGMAKFDAQAKAMGLSMSEDAVNGAIALNRSLKDMKMAAQGALVSLGTALLPILQPVAEGLTNLAMKGVEFLREKIAVIMPTIQGIADAFGEFFGILTSGGDPIFALQSLILDLAQTFGMGEGAAFNLAIGFGNIIDTIRNAIDTVIEFLAPIWEAVTSFVSWNDILVALGIVIAAVVVPAILGIIATLAPIIATVVLVVAAVALLRNAWENNFGGIQEKAAAVWAWLQVAFANIKEWLAVALPAAIQILSDFWSNVLQPAIAAVWAWLSTVLMPFIINVVVPWLQENIPKAIQKLSDFWTTVLWPAMQDVWAFIKNSLIPIFLDVVGWLADNIPKAISTAKTFWEEHLKPALEAVWKFIKEDLWPVFLDVGEWLLTTIGTAIKTAAGFWNDTLKPAISNVWSFIEVYAWPVFLKIATWLGETIGKVITTAAGFWNDTLKPALEAVWKFIKEDLLPIFEDIGGFLKDTLQGILNGISGAFDAVAKAVQWVIDKIKEVIEWFAKVGDSLPDWLNPGSPTPLEMGLRGIAAQLKNINQLTGSMPLFNGLSATMPALAMAGTEDSQSSISGSYNNSYTTITTNRDPLRILNASRHLDKLGRLH
ncbi:MAG: phage tail tape measure protein, partial [Anaerolineales bacterium]|nr:phage tail tape measure protein [Anaerolineales bacterium]